MGVLHGLHQSQALDNVTNTMTHGDYQRRSQTSRFYPKSSAVMVLMCGQHWQTLTLRDSSRLRQMQTTNRGRTPGAINLTEENMREITPCASHIEVAKLMAELIKGQGTRYQLAARTGLHRNYVSRMLKALKDQGCVYVIGWDKDITGRYQQAIFTLGFGEDVPRPPRQTQKERDAKRYRKMKEKAMAPAPVKTSFVGGSLWQ